MKPSKMDNFFIQPDLSYTFVIFGGTGDLTHRKLMPALYNLQYENTLPKNINIVIVGRREYSDDEYQEEVNLSIKKYSRFKFDQKTWDEFNQRIYYKQLDFVNNETFCELNEYLLKIENKLNTLSQRIYYLAVAPEYFGDIVDNLKLHCIDNVDIPPRLVIEKPFGKDLNSAQYLNTKIINAFSEENIYRIDHYLGKEMLQNIMVIRFSNILFEPLWNNQYIEQVQILSSETLGIGSRGSFYEKSGAIRDMLQSHLLQLLSLIAMDKPASLNNNDIRNEKVRILKALRKFTPETVKTNVVRGQYIGYADEEKVNKNSKTETFIALKTFVENERWKGVPFYIRTGKKMVKKTTEIIIQFKHTDNELYKNTDSNLLVFKIQPEEGISFAFNAKKVASTKTIIPVKMDFCQNCQIGFNSPEAYERLLSDVMRGDTTLFARWDEVEYSWRFIDTILNEWEKLDPKFPNYEAGTWGPKLADDLINNDQRYWINNEGDYDENI